MFVDDRMSDEKGIAELHFQPRDISSPGFAADYMVDMRRKEIEFIRQKSGFIDPAAAP